MKKRDKSKKKAKKSEREIERIIAGSGLKGSAQEMARQYGRGLDEGMRIAYLAVAERLLRAGNSQEEIKAFFAGMLESSEIEALLSEVMKPNKEQSS